MTTNKKIVINKNDFLNALGLSRIDFSRALGLNNKNSLKGYETINDLLCVKNNNTQRNLHYIFDDFYGILNGSVPTQMTEQDFFSQPVPLFEIKQRIEKNLNFYSSYNTIIKSDENTVYLEKMFRLLGKKELNLKELEIKEQIFNLLNTLD